MRSKKSKDLQHKTSAFGERYAFFSGNRASKNEKTTINNGKFNSKFNRMNMFFSDRIRSKDRAAALAAGDVKAAASALLRVRRLVPPRLAQGEPWRLKGSRISVGKPMPW